MNIRIVITTVQKPTAASQKMAQKAESIGAKTIIVGDRKGPFSYDVNAAELYTIDAQQNLPFALATALPENHYSRKNLGYLLAIQQQAECLFETDDDNYPDSNWTTQADRQTATHITGMAWCNVYRYFHHDTIWPRGFPLEHIRDTLPPRDAFQQIERVFPIQQLLADGSPDVDAIWRLVLDEPIRFARNEPVALGNGVWCPFNSQATWWWPEAYRFLYLPSSCSFRMTDIWRSFIAQRCLWEEGHNLLFHSAGMFQERNVHDLMRDFRDEVDGYLNNRKIADILENLELVKGQKSKNLETCYRSLCEAGYFSEAELELVSAWNADLDRLSVTL